MKINKRTHSNPSVGHPPREAVLAAARLTALGLAASAVDRCPVPGCAVCDRIAARAA